MNMSDATAHPCSTPPVKVDSLSPGVIYFATVAFKDVDGYLSPQSHSIRLEKPIGKRVMLKCQIKWCTPWTLLLWKTDNTSLRLKLAQIINTPSLFTRWQNCAVTRKCGWCWNISVLGCHSTDCGCRGTWSQTSTLSKVFLNLCKHPLRSLARDNAHHHRP